MKRILITGSAGFIGSHLVKALLVLGYEVIGLDNLNDYYDPELKYARLLDIEHFARISSLQNEYHFYDVDISNVAELNNIFAAHNFNGVVNLAAQAGVRYSIENPRAYIDSNLVGFSNILECCRQHKVEHLLFASSSSVYGMNQKQPFSTTDNTDFPISLYAATKKSNELLAHSYSHLFDLPCTGLRFFTVYGPFGRPDMAYFKFTKAIMAGDPIDVFNNGIMKRDFTYIDDIVEGITRLIGKLPTKQKNTITASNAPFKVYNIGNNAPVTLDRFVKAIEKATGRKAKRNLLPMQPGDVPLTFADIDELELAIGFKPSTSIEAGIVKFVDWYKNYHTVS